MNEQQMPLPFTPESGGNMIATTGIVFYDVDFTEFKKGQTASDFIPILNRWIADRKSIGSTTGDPTITIPQSMTRIATNELHADVIGMFDPRPSGDEGVSISVTMQELTRQNWLRICPGAIVDPDTGAIRISRDIPRSAYKHMAHVSRSTGGEYQVHILRNCIQFNNVVATYSNTVGTPANVPVVFRASLATIEEMQGGVQPYDLFIFPAEASGIGGLGAPFAAADENKNDYSEREYDEA